MKKQMIALTAAVLVASPVLADTAELDTDGDGVVSFNEMLVKYPTLTEDGFAAVDTNADGVVDETELTAASDAGLIPEG